MALSMFQACVPVITQLLNGLSGVVDKAAAHVAEKKYDESAFLQARLFPDMFPLGRQIRQATDFGRNAPGRLAGVNLPAFPDADASFAEAKARIAKSIDFVKGFTPAQIDGTEDKDSLVRETGYPLNFVASIVNRMWQAGLWNTELIDDRELWKSDGSLDGASLFLHALVALGEITREPIPSGAKYFYAATGQLAHEWTSPDPLQ